MIYHPDLDDICLFYLYRTERWMYHPNLDDLYDPILDEMFLSDPKLDVLYNPLLDDSEHACKSSKGGSFV